MKSDQDVISELLKTLEPSKEEPTPMRSSNFFSAAAGFSAAKLSDASVSLFKLALERYHTYKRVLLIDPNKYSKVKIQGYSFSLNADLVLGTELHFKKTLQPNAMIRPKRMVTNISVPGMVTLSAVQIANVNVLIGEGDDAYIYGPNSFKLHTEFPTLDTSTRATMTGTYTSYVPNFYAKDSPFKFVLTFQGPSMLCGNG